MIDQATRQRVAVIHGCRTPFCKAGTALRDVRGVDLARLATRELLHRSGIEPDAVDEIILGQVVPSALVPNIAREADC